MAQASTSKLFNTSVRRKTQTNYDGNAATTSGKSREEMFLEMAIEKPVWISVTELLGDYLDHLQHYKAVKLLHTETQAKITAHVRDGGQGDPDHRHYEKTLEKYQVQIDQKQAVLKTIVGPLSDKLRSGMSTLGHGQADVSTVEELRDEMRGMKRQMDEMREANADLKARVNSFKSEPTIQPAPFRAVPPEDSEDPRLPKAYNQVIGDIRLPRGPEVSVFGDSLMGVRTLRYVTVEYLNAYILPLLWNAVRPVWKWILAQG